MALGDVHQNSDFDVIVGAKYGRLYTARFFCLFFYKILGWRRLVARNNAEHTRTHAKHTQTHAEHTRNNAEGPRQFASSLRWSARDGFCFNHFVTEKSYCLKPPYNVYWQELYRNLAPVFGDSEKINNFFKANSWAQETKNPVISRVFSGANQFGIPRIGSDSILANQKTLSIGSADGAFLEPVEGFAPSAPRLPILGPNLITGSLSNLSQDFIFTNSFYEDLRFKYKTSSVLKIFSEKILADRMGDYLEQLLKKFQLWKIKKNLKKFPPGYKPRITYNDEEVEIHLDTKRAETTKNKKYSYISYSRF